MFKYRKTVATAAHRVATTARTKDRLRFSGSFHGTMDVIVAVVVVVIVIFVAVLPSVSLRKIHVI